MDDNSPLNHNQQLLLDYVEKNPGCEFGDLIKYMHSRNIFWRSWYPDDYVFLERKKLIRRVVTPYPKPTVPELNLGTITLFPELSIINTDLANEPLSDHARTILAFIRDHPGLKDIEIREMMKIDETTFVLAFKVLRAHGLIKQHFVPIRNRPDPSIAPGYLTFYPA